MDDQPLILELLGKGSSARRENRPADAIEAYNSAVEMCRRAGLKSELAHALGGLGQIERDTGNEAAAIAHYTEASNIWRELNEPLRIAHTVRHVGDLQRHAHQIEQAERCYTEALEIYRHHARTQPLDLANALRGYAKLKEQVGDEPGASEIWKEADKLYAIAGVVRNTGA